MELPKGVKLNLIGHRRSAYLRFRFAHDRHRRPLGARRTDQPDLLRDLWREGAGARTRIWRRGDHGRPVQPQGTEGS